MANYTLIYLLHSNSNSGILLVQLQCPAAPRRAISMSIKPETNRGTEIDQYSKKSKHLFKALLSIHRFRKETVPNKYSDDR